jgi:DNA mismatch repair protein MutL
MSNFVANRIKVLPIQLVNKIAAGEVIERPASCIKELIENALDAKATEIEIAVKEGGKKLIRVIDNGVGIIPEDLPLVFKSHSTSKINAENDLYNIQTFGFRGEALASIASVSQIRLVSKVVDQDNAYEITIDNDKITAPEPVAGVNGTVIEITNLFYQTPARRKFLKSDSIELSHITEIITRFAIAYPEVSFNLTNLSYNLRDVDNKQNHLTAGVGQSLMNLKGISERSSKSIMQRLAFFYGDDIFNQLISLREERDGVIIEAYFSLPTYTRPTSKYQFIYLNRRFIKDKIISRAIYQAYHNLIPSGRYPFVMIFLEMPASAFDVNVHPTKIEVRFRDIWRLHDYIILLIRKLLSEKGSIESQEIESSTGENINVESMNSINANESQKVMQALVNFFESSSTNHSGAQENLGSHTLFFSQQARADSKNNWCGKIVHTGRYFQIHNSYIVDEVVDGVLIIDQHALHERILYDRLNKQITSSELYKQKLLIPAVIEISKPKMVLINELIPHLKAVGIEIEEFGENSIAIRSAPSILNNVNLKEFIIEFIDTYADDISDSSEKDSGVKNIKQVDNLIKLMACKGAIKAGDALSSEEIKALMTDCNGIDWVTCPHGRPAIYKITLSELEGFFLR